jgi:hypothetical protein
MIPPATLFLGLAAQILLKTIAVWAFAPRLSYLWSMHMPVRYSLSSLPDPLPFIALLREGALELFQVFLCGSIPLAVSLCACALASRLAMAGRTAFTASLLALIAGAAALLLSLGLGRRFSVPWHAGLWEPWVQFGGSAAFLWIVTSVTLWRLRRQVAELYGMRT